MTSCSRCCYLSILLYNSNSSIFSGDENEDDNDVGDYDDDYDDEIRNEDENDGGDKDSKDDKTSKEPSKEKPKKLAPLMNKNPFGGMMGAMGLDDDLLDDLDDMESKLFGRSRKNQKKEEDPRLAYLKNIPQKHVEKIENEIMETLANVSWDEICGLQFVKGTIREIVILPFLRPDIFNGILQPPTGLLLFGPPGNSLHFLKYRVTSFDVFLFEIVCFVNFKDWTKMQK